MPSLLLLGDCRPYRAAWQTDSPPHDALMPTRSVAVLIRWHDPLAALRVPCDRCRVRPDRVGDLARVLIFGERFQRCPAEIPALASPWRPATLYAVEVAPRERLPTNDRHVRVSVRYSHALPLFPLGAGISCPSTLTPDHYGLYPRHYTATITHLGRRAESASQEACNGKGVWGQAFACPLYPRPSALGRPRNDRGSES